MEQKIFENRILQYIKQKELLVPKEQVIVGCSGGADSVALLLVLYALKEQLDIQIWPMHVEHGIRGEESLKDAEFVAALCHNLQMDVYQKNVDVPAFAKEKHLGLEEAARILRYQAFVDYAAEVHAQTKRPVKIAVAHHLDDNAETILFQMMRGSGLRGMCGMHALYQQKVTCIRPLLGVSREDIEQYLAQMGQAYCVDATNTDVNYSRNCIRHEVLPKLRKLNRQAVTHMNQTANRLQQVYDFLTEEADKAERQVIKYGACVCVQIPAFLQLHPALQTELMRRAIVAATQQEKDISAVHVEQLLQLLEKQSGREMHLPYQVVARVEYDTLVLVKEHADKSVCPEDIFENQIAIDEKCLQKLWESGENTVLWEDAADGVLTAKVMKKIDGNQQISKKTYTKQLDYDKIKSGFFLRKRQPQDYFVLDEAGHHKKFSDYLINEKIPATVRDQIWLLANGNEIIWAVGYRMGYNYKITEETQYILEITYNRYGGLEDGLYEKA